MMKRIEDLSPAEAKGIRDWIVRRLALHIGGIYACIFLAGGFASASNNTFLLLVVAASACFLASRIATDMRPTGEILDALTARSEADG